ncbi:UNVERIFIED_CONTAM: hypothetical protein GTU68_006064, partial [Idotea baltica]|nr:hypothetical protein [Idotea baltica]
FATTGLPLFTVAALINKKTFPFIIDTGSSISIIPYGNILDCEVKPTVVKLKTANGQSIKVYGEVSLPITIPKLHRTFNWTFVVAEVTNFLLGKDFLYNYHFLVDCTYNLLIDGTTRFKVSADRVCTKSVTNFLINNTTTLPTETRETIDKYQSLLAPQHFCAQSFDRNIFHRIDTGSACPTFLKPRSLPPDKLQVAKNSFNDLLNNGIVTATHTHTHTHNII